MRGTIRKVRRFWKKGSRLASPFLLALAMSFGFILSDIFAKDRISGWDELIIMILLFLAFATAMGAIYFFFFELD